MKLLYFLFFINVLSQDFPIINGTCGETEEACFYEFDIFTHTLTVIGNGEMSERFSFKSETLWGMLGDLAKTIIIKGLTVIPTGAFEYFYDTDEIYISDVSVIKSEAFYYCPGLYNLTLKNVNEIEDSAFSEVNNLKSVFFKGNTIPSTCSKQSFSENVKYAIVDYDNTNEEICGMSVMRIDENGNKKGICGLTENDCSWSFNIETKILEINGNGEMKFETTTNGKVIVPWEPFSSFIEKVIISNVLNIAERSFYSYDKLKEVLISGVSKIERDSFYGCDTLFKVTIGEGLQEIQDYSFYSCNKLDGIYYTETTQPSICPSDSYGFDYLFIVNYNYEGNDFCGNEIIRSDENGNINNICGNTEEECSWSFTKSTQTLSIQGNGQMTIVKWSFLGEDVLEIKIEGIKNIYEKAFSYFSKIKEVIIPDSVEEIQEWAFEYCSSLEQVILGKNIQSMSYDVFRHCSSLKEMRYTGLKDIPNCDSEAIVFSNPFLLKYIYVSKDYVDDTVCYMTIAREMGNGELSIGGKCGDTEEECSWDYNEESKTLSIYGNGKMKNSMSYPPWISLSYGTNKVSMNGITSIGMYSFYTFFFVEEFIIPDTIKTISSYAFYGIYFTNKITIPESVEVISPYSFIGCYFLKELEYKGTKEPKVCSSTAFIGSPLISVLRWPSTYEDSSFCGKPVIHEGEKIKLEGLCGKTKEDCYWKIDITESKLIIEGNGYMNDYGTTNHHAPWSFASEFFATIEIKGIKSIGNNSFKHLEEPQSFTITDTITRIGDFAFFESRFYPKVQINITKKVEHIGKNPFSMAGLIIKVDPENQFFTYQKGALFNKDMTRLINYFGESKHDNVDYIIPEGVVSLDPFSFSGGYFQNLQFPKSLTTIEDFAFSNSYFDNQIIIPENVEYIGIMAFMNTEIPSIEYKGFKEPLYCNEYVFFQVSLLNHIDVPSNYEGKQFCGIQVVKGDYKASKLKEGKCGLTEEDCYYTYNSDSKKLTITGNYKMFDYTKNSYERPWHWYFDEMKSIEIQTNLKTIGDFAFYNMSKVETIVIKESIEEIGSEAFGRCDSLKSISYEGEKEPQCTNDVFRGTDIKKVETTGTYKLDEVCGIIENDSQIPTKEESSEKPKDESSQQQPPEQKEPESNGVDNSTFIAVTVSLSVIIFILLILVIVLTILFTITIIHFTKHGKSNYEELKEGI